MTIYDKNMTIRLRKSEQNLIDYAKKAVVKYNQMRHKKGSIDTLYSFLISASGRIYDGACFESNLSHAAICGERLAIANMVMSESYSEKIKSIVVADPVPKIQTKSTPPCGTCRHLIWEFGSPDTTVILMQYLQRKNSWFFPKIEKYNIKQLYPYPYEPIEGLWDNYVPPHNVSGSRKI